MEGTYWLDIWYDPFEDVWVIQKNKEDGTQVGMARFTAFKKEALEEAKEWCQDEEIGRIVMNKRDGRFDKEYVMG